MHCMLLSIGFVGGNSIAMANTQTLTISAKFRMT